MTLAAAAPIAVEFASMHPDAEKRFVSEVCLPFLQAARNEDGGWGFHTGSESRVEATAWVVMVLREMKSREDLWQAGCDFLRAMQLADGSWPSSPGQTVGSWTTSLACWALMSNSGSKTAVAAGLRWMCADWPRESGLIARAIRRISAGKPIVAQNSSLHGWGWTPHTASWVEPTAFALIALDQAAAEILPEGAPKRRRIATSLLYDRMCPGGGWNCGNPMVYGVPGDPVVEPTAWALLALRDEPNRGEILMSLEWLEKNLARIESARSLALARICWETYGRIWPAGVATLPELYARNDFLDSVPAMAWACLALSAEKKLLFASRPEGNA